MRNVSLKQLHLSKFGEGAIALVVAIPAIVVVLSYAAGAPLLQVATAVGSLSTAVGVLMALLSGRQETTSHFAAQRGRMV
jgi:bacteriorhodopsin